MGEQADQAPQDGLGPCDADEDPAEAEPSPQWGRQE